MTHADFVHLRVHSAYSLSEGAIKLKQLIALCQQFAMPAVAVTDTGNLFGALEFALAGGQLRQVNRLAGEGRNAAHSQSVLGSWERPQECLGRAPRRPGVLLIEA